MADCASTVTAKCLSLPPMLPSRAKFKRRMVHQRHCPAGVKQTQELALSLELYLVRQVGPTSWMVGTRGGDPHRVCVGVAHSCSCPVFRSTRDICVHLAWILIRKLGLQMTNPLSYQLGMTERELNDCLNPPRREERQRTKKPRVPKSDKPIPVKRRTVQDGDQCPICLEEFSTKRSPVVYCKYSCGQVMHGGCMQVVAKHQEGPDLTCPLCRGHFSSMAELRQAVRISFLPPLSKFEPAKNKKVWRCSAPQKPDQPEGRFNEAIKTHRRTLKIDRESQKLNKRPKYLPKINPRTRGPSALLEESPNIKCPICTDQGFNIVTLECGHLIPTPDPARTPLDPDEEFKRPPRTPCGRLSRRGPLGKQFVPPPEVMVQRLELVQRSAPPLAASRPRLRPKKKKEATPEPQPPDPRENGRILGSKVLPLMALLLRKADEDDDGDENEVEESAKPSAKEEKNGKRKLTIQCVQLLPDAEAMPVKPGASRHYCHR